VCICGQTLPADPPKTGHYQTRFEQRGELGLWPDLAKRFRWRGVQLSEPYEVKEQTFEVFVPGTKPETGYTLLVWVSASEDGSPPDGWLPVLERRGIIWVGANQSGNDHPAAYRFGLAIDAAQNMATRHGVDASRVFISGISGGGRVSSMLAPAYPDLFRGAIYIVGCNYWKDLDVPGDPESFWRKLFNEPPEDMLKLAKERSRFVFLAGETDMNREQTKATREAYKADGFKHTAYIEVPGMGHDLPNAEWLDKALDAMLGPPAASSSAPGVGK
jgi:predicted esterase